MRRSGGKFPADQELVEALRAGDKNALEQVYTMCYPAFESFVRKGGGTQADAKDCFQEGVLSVWVNVRNDRYQLRETAAFKTYVLGVCKFKWMNKIRSAYHKSTVPADTMPDIGIVETDDALEERLLALNTGLSSLGQVCQDILRMFYFEKLSYEEMEERTGNTPESLKNQKYRCINRLKEYMQNLETSKK